MEFLYKKEMLDTNFNFEELWTFVVDLELVSAQMVTGAANIWYYEQIGAQYIARTSNVLFYHSVCGLFPQKLVRNVRRGLRILHSRQRHDGKDTIQNQSMTTARDF